MDNRAKNLGTQLSDHSINNNAASQRINPTDAHDHGNIQHLTIAKYLPAQTFKQPRTLIAALNQIHLDSRRMTHASRKTMLVHLAKNIAITTTELNVDYGTKLSLIRAASSHPLFKSKNILKLAVKFISKHIFKNDPRTEAQKILDDTITSIQCSRNHIILC